MTEEIKKEEKVEDVEIPVVEEEVKNKSVDFSNKEFNIKLKGSEVDFVVKAINELPIKTGGFILANNIMKQLQFQAKVKLETEEIIKNKD